MAKLTKPKAKSAPKKTVAKKRATTAKASRAAAPSPVVAEVDSAEEITLDPLPASNDQFLYKRNGSRKLKVTMTMNLRQPVITNPKYDQFSGDVVDGEFRLVISEGGKPTYMRCTREVYDRVTRQSDGSTGNMVVSNRAHRKLHRDYGAYFFYRDVVNLPGGKVGLSYVNDVVSIDAPNFDTGYGAGVSGVGAPTNRRLYEAMYAVDLEAGTAKINSGLFGVPTISLINIGETLASLTEVQVGMRLFPHQQGMEDVYVAGIRPTNKPGVWLVGVRKTSSDQRLDEVEQSGLAIETSRPAVRSVS